MRKRWFVCTEYGTSNLRQFDDKAKAIECMFEKASRNPGVTYVVTETVNRAMCPGILIEAADVEPDRPKIPRRKLNNDAA